MDRPTFAQHFIVNLEKTVEGSNFKNYQTEATPKVFAF